MTTILANAIGFSRNNTAVIDTLISNGVDVNLKPGRMRSPVMIAAIGNSLAALKSLIVAGADCSEVFKLYNYSVYKKTVQNPNPYTHKELVKAMNEAKLELYIKKTRERGENHYKHALTISFFCFTKTFHFGGYSSTEKLKAAEKLEKVLAGESNETSLNKKKYKGALNNGELKTIYRALMRR